MTAAPLPGLELRDLRGSGDVELLRRLYDRVLVPYFAAAELVPLSELHGALLSEPSDTDIAVAVDDEGAVIGGAVGDWDPESGVYLLSYLAVRATARSRGVGTLLMDRVRSWWEARDARVALAEVDDPRYHEVSEYGDPHARLRFYERLGAQVLGVPYTQPEVHPGRGRVHGMLLVTLLVRPDARVGDGMRVDVLRRFLANYLVLSERVLADEVDAEITSLVPGIDDRPAVPILPMSRYVDV